jgi:DNA-binding ferritin-like protein (Dps family)
MYRRSSEQKINKTELLDYSGREVVSFGEYLLEEVSIVWEEKTKGEWRTVEESKSQTLEEEYQNGYYYISDNLTVSLSR